MSPGKVFPTTAAEMQHLADALRAFPGSWAVVEPVCAAIQAAFEQESSSAIASLAVDAGFAEALFACLPLKVLTATACIMKRCRTPEQLARFSRAGWAGYALESLASPEVKRNVRLAAWYSAVLYHCMINDSDCLNRLPDKRAAIKARGGRTSVEAATLSGLLLGVLCLQLLAAEVLLLAQLTALRCARFDRSRRPSPLPSQRPGPPQSCLWTSASKSLWFPCALPFSSSS